MKDLLLLIALVLSACGSSTNTQYVPLPYPVPAGPQTNIACAVYDLSSLPQFSLVPNFDTIGISPDGTINTGTLNNPEGTTLALLTSSSYPLSTQVGLKCTSKLIIPNAGNYQFNLSSDDGSLLYINGNLVITNDGQHGYPGATPTGSYSFSAAGNYQIEVDYFNNFGPAGLTLSWDGGLGGPVGVIASDNFSQ